MKTDREGPIIESTGEKLASRLSEAGMSKRQLAQEAGVSYRTVCRIVAGDKVGYLDTWMKFAGVLGCDVSEIVSPERGSAMDDFGPDLTDEFADYMRGWSKRYLQRVRSSIHTVAQLESEMAELDEMMDGIRGVDYSREKVSAPANDDGMVNAISRMESLKAEYRDELDAHLQVKADAHAALRNVRQPWRSVLTYRYLHGMPWADVAASVGYSEVHCKGELHSNGLLELYAFIPHDELPDAM